MVKSIVAPAPVPAALSAVIVTLKLPAALGCPVISPVAVFKFRPAGKVPVATAKMVGFPVATTVCEKDAPTLPLKLVAVITGGTLGATGVPFTDALATLAPTLLTAFKVTGYVVPLLSPEIVRGLLVEAGDRTT